MHCGDDDMPSSPSPTILWIKQAGARLLHCAGIAMDDAGKLVSKISKENQIAGGVGIVLWVIGSLMLTSMGCPWPLALAFGAPFLAIVLLLGILGMVIAFIIGFYFWTLWTRAQEQEKEKPADA